MFSQHNPKFYIIRNAIQRTKVVFYFFNEEVWHLSITDTFGRLGIGYDVFGSDALIGLGDVQVLLLKVEISGE